MNAGSILFATQQSSQWTFGYEGTRYPPSSPWPAYYHQHHHHCKYQPRQRGPFQLLPLPVVTDVPSEEKAARSGGKVSKSIRAHTQPARRSETASPGSPATHTLSPGSPESLIRNISLRSTGSRDVVKPHRPSYWRQDYVPPSSPWIKKRFLELRSLVTDDVPTFATSNFHRALRLNPLLRFSSPLPPSYYFDLRNNPVSTPIIHLPTSNGPITQLHHLQLATTPSTHQLYLWHPSLPWTLIIRSSNTSGILVSDILKGIYEELMTPIGVHDWYNSEMTAEDRERIEETYKVRCGGDIDALMGGIRRMDWLGAEVGFLGLCKSWNGMWEIKTVDVIDFGR